MEIALAIINFLAFGWFAVWYYFFFGLRFGGYEGFLTWGLPYPIAALLALICGILTLIRKSWRWGVAGLAVVLAAGIYLVIILINISMSF